MAIDKLLVDDLSDKHKYLIKFPKENVLNDFLRQFPKSSAITSKAIMGCFFNQSRGSNIE